MKQSLLRTGGQWLFLLLLLASRGAGPLRAQSPSDATFLATLGQLRDATFDDKDKLVDQLAQSGHLERSGPSSPRCSKTASTTATTTRRSSSKSAADENTTSVDLIDPLSPPKPAGSAIDR